MNRRRFALLPIAIAIFVAGLQYCSAPKFKNPETGRSAHVALSEEQEAALGLASYREVLSQSHVISTGRDVERIQNIVARLASAITGSAALFRWEVSLIQGQPVNAFCLPGGKICVYTGLLQVATTDAELATVLGHEMAHAVARHGAQRLFESKMASTLMAGAQFSIGMSQMDPQQKQLVLGAFGAGANLGVLLPFSRKHESEADEMGLKYMARAGYDPRAALTFWERMSQATGNHIPELASTHPSHETRIQRLKTLLPEALDIYRSSLSHKSP